MEPLLDEIIPSLYLTGIVQANNDEALMQHKITHILQVSGQFTPKFPDLCTYKVIKIDD